jgi:hypothetical protein
MSHLSIEWSIEWGQENTEDATKAAESLWSTILFQRLQSIDIKNYRTFPLPNSSSLISGKTFQF